MLIQKRRLFDMKAPDKIYIQTNAGETISSKWTTIPFRDFENTEYIRKDALIEWLENKIKISDGGFVNGLICLAYKDVIEHLNEM